MITSLVTGGGGFIGSNLVRRLIAEGHQVFMTGGPLCKCGGELKFYNIGFDDGYTCKTCGRLYEVYESNGIRRNINVVAEDFRNINFKVLPVIHNLFHLAAITDTTVTGREVMAVNCDAALSLFEKAIAAKCRRIVYASSCAVYGDVEPPFREEGPTNPLNDYAKSKLALDAAVKELKTWVPIVGLRYSNVYGPGESRKGKSASMVLQIIDSIKAGKRPRLFEDGEQKRDFVHVDDVVRATLKAAACDYWEILNIGSGIATSFNQVVAIVNWLLRTDLRPEYIPNNIAGVFQNHTECDISRAAQVIGYRPRLSITQGISRYLDAIGRQADS